MEKRQGSLTPDDFPKPGEARREVRVPTSKPIQILPCKAARDWRFIDAELCDCSLNGLGLLTHEAMEVGEQFLVKFKQNGVRLLQYTVRHRGTAADGRYKVGAEFTGLAATAHDTDRQPILDELLAPE